MVAPTAFGFNEEAAQDNSFMHDGVPGEDDSSAGQVRAKVLREFAGLHRELSEASPCIAHGPSLSQKGFSDSPQACPHLLHTVEAYKRGLEVKSTTAGGQPHVGRRLSGILQGTETDRLTAYTKYCPYATVRSSEPPGRRSLQPLVKPGMLP